MTSFATDEAIRAHVVERDLGEPLVFNQFVSLRLEPSGELFRDESGRHRSMLPATATSSRHFDDRGRSLPFASEESGS